MAIYEDRKDFRWNSISLEMRVEIRSLVLNILTLRHVLHNQEGMLSRLLDIQVWSPVQKFG